MPKINWEKEAKMILNIYQETCQNEGSFEMADKYVIEFITTLLVQTCQEERERITGEIDRLYLSAETKRENQMLLTLKNKVLKP